MNSKLTAKELEVDLWWLGHLNMGPEHMKKVVKILNEPFEEDALIALQDAKGENKVKAASASLAYYPVWPFPRG